MSAVFEATQEEPGASRPASGRSVNIAAGLIKSGIPWLYLLPVILTLAVWTYIPLIETFWLSFYQWNMLPTAKKTFVGILNYERLVALPDLQKSLWNTLLYVLGLFPMSVLLPLTIAILTQNLSGPLRLIYRTLIFLPMIIAPVVAAILWRWLFNFDFGLLNQMLDAGGFDRIGFLLDPAWALPALTLITGWKLVGFSTLLFSAANAGINPSYIEAARIDGASPWQIVRDIRLPLLSPTILLLTMMTILFGAQWTFVYINVLTHGGPLKSTTNIFHLLWVYGFETLAVGWSSAAGIMTFVVFATLAWVCMAFMRKFAVHEA